MKRYDDQTNYRGVEVLIIKKLHKNMCSRKDMLGNGHLKEEIEDYFLNFYSKMMDWY